MINTKSQHFAQLIFYTNEPLSLISFKIVHNILYLSVCARVRHCVLTPCMLVCAPVQVRVCVHACVRASMFDIAIFMYLPKIK